MNPCPVCGYSLRKPVEEGLICPSCGTQFGYTDANRSFAQIRDEWIGRGMIWFSRRTSPPAGWNPVVQLRRSQHITEESITKTTSQKVSPLSADIFAIEGVALEYGFSFYSEPGSSGLGIFRLASV